MNRPRPQTGLERVFRWHLKRYPLIQTQDLVKLSYQAAFGNRHIMGVESRILPDLQAEIASLKSDMPKAILIEPLSADLSTGWARVSLAGWQARGGGLGQLVEIMTASATGPVAGLELFHLILSELDTFLNRVKPPICGESIAYWHNRMRREDYPPQHHSPTYKNAYRPAYRVVCYSLLAGFLPLRPAAG